MTEHDAMRDKPRWLDRRTPVPNGVVVLCALVLARDALIDFAAPVELLGALDLAFIVLTVRQLVKALTEW